MGTVSDGMAGFAKCVAECNFDCRNVRVYHGAGYGWGGNVALGYVATILAIVYVRAAGKIAGAPNEFCGPMAKQHRMLVITVACLYSAVVPR